MENCVNVTPLETELSLFSFKNMKKQESFRYHMISAFLAMVEMVHAIHAVWDALLPFALLWWNVMLCATCAKYYSWNRFRFRLQIVGRELHGAVVEDANAAETRESLHQRKDASHVAVITDYPSISFAPALCTSMVEVGSCYIEQSLTFAESCNMHRNELLTLNLHVDNIATATDGQHDHQFEDLNSREEAPVVFNAHPSKALDMAPALPTSKLSSIHVFDIREREQSGLLTAAYWAACPFLLPQQVAPLAVYDPSSCPQKLLECLLWMHSSACIYRNLLKGKALIQLLYTVSINCSTVEECFHVMNGGVASRFTRTIGGKEYTRMARILTKLHESRACSRDSTMLQVALLFHQIVQCLKSTVSFEALESTTEDLNLKIKEHPSTSIFSNSGSECNSGYCHDNYAEDASEDSENLFSTPDQFYDSMLASGSKSSLNLNCVMEGGYTFPAYRHYEDAMIDSGEDMGFFNDSKLVIGSQSSLDSITVMEPGDAVPAYRRYEDRMVDNSEDVEVFHEEYVTQSDNYCDLYDGSTNLDFRYGGLQWLQEVDSMYGKYDRYYTAADGVCSDDYHDDDGLEVDSAVCGYSRVDEDWIIDESSKVKPFQQLNTWWDEDAVLLGRQEHEEDGALEQAWLLV